MPSVLSCRARRGQKTNSASCPREAARCRHVSLAARIATPFGCCKPAVPSAEPSCRRFPDQKSPPTTLDRPGLSAPRRKARSQKQVACPRRLREPSCLSLRASRVAAACCLRRSCRRDRGPVSLPSSGCPVRRSQHPAAIAQPLLPPLPAAFCGRALRLSPPVTPAKRRAIFKQQPVTNLQTKSPYTPNPQHYVLPLLDPAYALWINQQGVRFAHVRLLPPCAVGPQGPGALLFTAARGSRA